MQAAPDTGDSRYGEELYQLGQHIESREGGYLLDSAVPKTDFVYTVLEHMELAAGRA